MTDGCVQWSNRKEGLDTVVGPDEQERFVTDYRARHVNLFTPRVLVDAGDQFAYLWDVRTPEGQVRTGLDVNVLSDDRIHENWTFVGERHCDQPDPEPAAAGLTDPDAIERLARCWVQLRNGQAELAQELVTSDFALFYGESSAGDVNGQAELAALVEKKAAPAIAIHRHPVIDLARGSVAFLWTAEATEDGVAVGGVDLLTAREGRIARAWSLTGIRAFRY
ncbi:hypothetical protein [Kutzneria buriramensis]|nr:hypothetical protein [Kutzneria buriramensis]